MGLLTYAYDPVGTANVLVRAMEVGQQRSSAQQQMLMDLAKSLADSRRHDIEFDRTQSFNQYRDDAERGYKERAAAESRRRYDLENAPISPTTPTAPTGTVPVSGDPLNASDPTAAVDVPPPEVQPSAPGVNLYNAGSGADQSQPLLAAPSFAADLNGDAPLSAPDTALPDAGPMQLQAGPVNPLEAPQYDVPDMSGENADPLATPNIDPADLALRNGAQQVADTTMNGPHGQLVPRIATNPALQTRAGRAATIGNPLMPEPLPDRPGFRGGSDILGEAQNRMAAAGIPRKVAIPKLAQLSEQLALRDSPAPGRPPTQLPDGSYVIGGKQYVKQKDGSYTTAVTANDTQTVEGYQQSKGWSKDVDPASPTFGALLDKDGAAHWVHVGGNGKVVDMPARPPSQRIGFDEKGKAAELGYVPKDGMWFDPATNIYHRAGENGFLGVNPREAQSAKGPAPLKPTTTEQIWATQNAAMVDRMNVIKPLLDKAGLPLTANYDDMKKAIDKGTMTKPQADYANYWLGKFKDSAGKKSTDSTALGNLYNQESAKLQVLKAKGVTVTPIDPTELRNAMLQEGTQSPDPKVSGAAVDALAKQGIKPTTPPPTATPAPASPTATPAPATPAAKTIWKEDASGVKWEYDATTKKPTGLHILPSKAAA
jgi:hypothetical protein